jgi:hypothetical protein
MIKHKNMRILSAVLAIVIAVGTYVAIPDSGAYADDPGVIPTSDSAAEWSEIQDIIGSYQGEWHDSSYPGLVTSRVPNTALLGNGDVGIASGGDSTSKSYYISKGDFWRFKGSPVPIGGLKIAPIEDTEPEPVSLIQGKAATANSSHGDFPPSLAVNGAWGPGYEGWTSNNDRTNGAASTVNPWILTIDAGEAVTFNRYVVRHDGAARPAEMGNNTKEFAIEISDNGTDWTEIDKVENNSAATTDIVLEQAHTARYVRIVVYKGIQNDTASNPRARIGQFELFYEEGSAPVNLALNKPVTASSSHPELIPSRAVNGQWTSEQKTGSSADRYEGWSSNVQASSTPWLKVDLQEATTFDHFIIKFDHASRKNNPGDNTSKKTPKTFEIQVSDDDQNWESVWSVSDYTVPDLNVDDPDSATFDEFFDEVTARYVRVWLTVPNQQSDNDTIGNPRGCIGQFELYFGGGPGEMAAVADLAQGKPTTANAQLSAGLGPERATDGVFVLGNNRNREGWASGLSTPGQWLQVDLGEPTTFNKYLVAHDGAVRGNQAGNPKSFQIRGSDDGETWEVIDEITNNTAGYNEVILDSPVTYRYVQFYILQVGQEPNSEMGRCGAFRLYYQPDILQNVTGEAKADGYTYYTLPKDWKIGTMLIGGAQTFENVLLQFSKDNVKWKTAFEAPDVEGSALKEFGPFIGKYWRIKAGDEMDGLKLFASDKPETRTSSLNEVEDILNAEIRTDFMYDDDRLAMRSFMTATDNIFVTEVTSNTDYPVDVRAGLWAAANNAGTFPFESTAKADSVAVSRTANPGNANSEVQATPYYTKAVLESKVIGADVETSKDSNSEAGMTFTIDPDETVYIVTAVGGGGPVYQRAGNAKGPLFDGVTEPDDEAAELLATIEDAADVAALESAHDAWWKDYWMKSYVNLDAGDSDMDTIMKYYYAAQYELGSGIREGNVAAGLYGIWHTTDTPSWNSDFHLNYNFISTYYGVSSSNRPELNLPPVQAMLDYGETQGFWNAAHTSVVRRINNQFTDYKVGKGDIDETDGVPGGLLAPVGVGPFGFDLDLSFHSEALNAGFSIYPMLEYYNFTQDDAWLQSSGVYEYIKGCITFYEAWLEEKPGKYEGQGKYLLYAGYNEGSWSIDPAVELATIKLLLNNGIRFSEILGVDAAERAKWQEILEGLSPQPTITVSGNKVNALAALEWPGYTYGSATNAWTTADDQWRVMSSPIPGDGNSIPLEAIVPGEVIGYYSDADTLETAQNTIALFDSRNQWGQINNFPKMFTQAVNIRYNPDRIVERFANTIRARMVANLMIEDNIHGVEKAGAVEAVNNMLLNSDQGVVKAFPNWPDDKDASFTRLREKGAFVISASYDGDEERVEYVDVTSEAGKTLTIAAPWADGVRVVDEDGEDVAFTTGTAPNHDEEATVTFATESGKSYRLTEREEAPADKTELQSAYDAAVILYDAIKDAADKYTVTSFNAFKAALDAAEAVISETSPTQADVDAALEALTTAQSKLTLRAGAAALTPLTGLVAVGEGLVEEDYVPSYWPAFADALSDAKDILASPESYSNDEVVDAAVALLSAMQDLYQHMRANKDLLSAIIENAETLLEEADKYVPVSVANLTAKLNAAKTVYDNAAATQAEVNAAYSDLLAAFSNMFEKGDKTALQILVNLSSIYREDNYTPATWEPFMDALDDAAAVLANANALQDSVETAYAALNDAIQNLARKANYATLQAAINAAQSIIDNIDDYVPSSVTGLADALNAAKLIRDDLNAAQTQVNAAAMALNTELLKARLKPDRSALLSMQSRARSMSLTIYTAASVEPLNAAMTRADEVLNASDEDITQEDVDAATNALAYAIAGLQLNPTVAVDEGTERPTSGVTDVANVTNVTGNTNPNDTGGNPGDASVGISGDASTDKSGDAASDKSGGKSDSKSGSKSGSKSESSKAGSDSTKSGNESNSNAATPAVSGGSAPVADDSNAAADSGTAVVEEPVVVADATPDQAATTVAGGDEGLAVIADEGVPATSPKGASGIPTGWLIAVIVLAAAVCFLLWLLYAKRKKGKSAA